MPTVGDGPYIFIQQGSPRVKQELPKWQPTRLSVINGFWEQLHAFGRTSRYRAAVPSAPHYGIVAKILALVGYNPRVPVAWDWLPTGDYHRGEIIALVEEGLKEDDDIIQQWFDAKDVLKLLRAGESHDRMILAVRAICGEYESDPTVRQYVDSVLTVPAESRRA